MSKIVFLFLAAFVLFSGCAGSGAAAQSGNNSSAQEAEAAAAAALAAMDGGGSVPASQSRPAAAPPAAQSRPAAAPSAANAGGRTAPRSSASGQKPAWVESPDAVYSSQQYVSAVGFGSGRDAAERDALGKLTAVFGQSIQAELSVISSYSEAVKSGTIKVSEDTSVQNAFSTSVEMDSLVGAEIADVWVDSKDNVHYAVAVMEKQRTSVLYGDLVRSNQRVIEQLITMTPAEKNSLDGYSRYLLAATVADANRVYANVLTIVGDTQGINPGELKKGDDYRLEASNIVRNIPIGVIVNGDRGDRIKGAFSKSFSAAGFRTGGNNSRYLMKVDYSAVEQVFPNNPNKFVQFQVSGGLVDTAEGDAVLVPYSFADRAGHNTVANAENRALQDVEKKIASEFEPLLKQYIANLVSK